MTIKATARGRRERPAGSRLNALYKKEEGGGGRERVSHAHPHNPSSQNTGQKGGKGVGFEPPITMTTSMAAHQAGAVEKEEGGREGEKFSTPRHIHDYPHSSNNERGRNRTSNDDHNDDAHGRRAAGAV